MSSDKSRSANTFAVFDYFGIQWAQIISLSGILLTGLGIADINPAAWTIGAVLSFFMVYTLKEFITHRYLIVFTIVVISICVQVAYFVWLGVTSPATILNILQMSTIVNALVSFAIAAVLGIHMSVLLASYNHHIRQHFEPLPLSFANSVRASLESSPFLRTRMFYSLKCIESSPEGVTFDFEVTYALKNLSGSPQRKQIRYPAPSRKFRVVQATVDQTDQLLTNNAVIGERDIRFDVNLMPGEEKAVTIKVVEQCPADGHDLLGSHDFCEQLEVLLVNDERNSIEFVISELCPHPGETTKTDSAIKWVAGAPIFPYQGIRVYWRQKDHGTQIPANG